MAAPPLIYIVAGEVSGDRLGGRLMAALQELTAGQVRFRGVGGESMRAEGLTSLFPMRDLSVMGLAEVLPYLPRLLRRLGETEADVRAAEPDLLLTIDAPGFNFRLARRLRGVGFPLVHYVAPTVWAWKPHRAKKIAAFLDHLLVLLPFEPPYFEREGLATTFVGHPVVDGGAGRGDGSRFRSIHGVDAEAPLLCVLPGSRSGEVRRHLPIFGAVARQLAAGRPGLRIVVPTVEAVAEAVAQGVSGWPGGPVVVRGEAAKFDAFDAAWASLAASGTVSLELAMAGCPAVVAYRVSPLTAAIVRRMIKVPYASLVNLIAGRDVVPEFIQQNCIPDNLTAALARLLDDPAARSAQAEGSRPALVELGLGGPPPSRRAAEAILEILARKV